MSYVLELEIPRLDEVEAVAVARGLAQEFSVNVNVYQVTLGRTFADDETRKLIATEEPK